ncbi:MAG: MFS transporter [Anaeromicrobium sp.]|jgi:MFS family permease|uniref:MFS transporter n=1 Tax=Anaeromicrobium sp. TaxID=1929132 RepID=UPI0025D1D4DA|nr:MFS transporter [Anaeromicrobium sp.]MCT4595120.1 MFS transporter [Anaeromicrobium sp.]
MKSKEYLNFILFPLGKFISIFGTSIYTFAIGLYVLKLTGSGVNFANTLVLGIMPIILFNPIGGVMADRFNKKNLVISMDILNGILFLLLYFISRVYGLNIIMIYISTFLNRTFTTIFATSLEVAIPNMVSDDKLVNINSTSKIIDSLSLIIGPVIGGIVFTFMDIHMFILFNGISFIISALCEMFIDFRYNYVDPIEEKKGVNLKKDMKEAFIYIKSEKNIINIFRLLIVINFFISLSITVPLPFIVNNVLKLHSKSFGIIEGSFSLGIIIGAIFVNNTIEKIEYWRLLRLMSIFMSVSMILVGIPVIRQIQLSEIFYLIYYIGVMISFGIIVSFIDIPFIYIIQKDIPSELRGRVLSIVISVGKAIAPIGLILSGGLLDKIPVYILPIGGGVLIIIFNLVVLNSFEGKYDKELDGQHTK